MTIEPLRPMERWELGQAGRERPENRGDRARTVAGLTAKQAAILATLIAHDNAWNDGGLTARDFEAQLARTAAVTGVLGWSAGDCTITLNRLKSRGLVKRKPIVGVKPGKRQARQQWFITKRGEVAYWQWLAQTNPRFADEVVFLAKLEAQRHGDGGRKPTRTRTRSA